MECNDHCREVILARISDGVLPPGEIYTDVCNLELSEEVTSQTTALTGGFPCQVSCLVCFSFDRVVKHRCSAEGVCQAGKMLGLADLRTGLIRQVFAIIDMCPHLSPGTGHLSIFGSVIESVHPSGYWRSWKTSSTFSLRKCDRSGTTSWRIEPLNLIPKTFYIDACHDSRSSESVDLWCAGA